VSELFQYLATSHRINLRIETGLGIHCSGNINEAQLKGVNINNFSKYFTGVVGLTKEIVRQASRRALIRPSP
jgi:hypothetical protein